MTEKTIDEITIRETMSGELTSKLLMLMHRDSPLLSESARNSELTVPIGVILEVLDGAYILGTQTGMMSMAEHPTAPPDPGVAVELLRKLSQATTTMIAVATKEASDV